MGIKNTVILDNVVLQTMLNWLRDKKTISTEFRQTLRNAGYLMTYEIIGREASKSKVKVKTVLGTANGITSNEHILQIMVMRAGEPFAEGGALLLDQINFNRNIGVVDARRVEGDDNNFDMDIDMGSFKVPEFNKKTMVIIYDPMLATASTMVNILNLLKKRGTPKKFIICSIIATPYGISKLTENFNNIKIYTLAVDKGGYQGLNKKGYIIPGLGDCGDRAFGNY